MTTEFDPIESLVIRHDYRWVHGRYVEIVPGNGTIYRVVLSSFASPLANQRVGFNQTDAVTLVSHIGGRCYPFRGGNGDVLAWSYLKEKLGLSDGDRGLLEPLAKLLGRTPHGGA